MARNESIPFDGSTYQIRAYKGPFESLAKLQNDFPLGESGYFAFLEDTESFVYWNKELNGWKNLKSVSETIKMKLIGKDVSSEVSRTEESATSEFSLVNFNGKLLAYYTAGWGEENEHIEVGDYDLDTNAISNPQTIANDDILGLGSTIYKCGYAFVYDGTVYLVLTAWFDNYCILMSSEDGYTFNVISTDLADSVSGFKGGMYGNHCILRDEANNKFYWFIEGRESIENTNSPWVVKILELAGSDLSDTSWSLIGKCYNLSDRTAGGTKVFLDNGKFKMFYHYSFGGNTLPCYIAYAESRVDDPTNFTPVYKPLIDITRNPFGGNVHVDQIADPEIVEIDGITYFFAAYVSNNSHLSTIYRWQSEYTLSDILNSDLDSESIYEMFNSIDQKIKSSEVISKWLNYKAIISQTPDLVYDALVIGKRYVIENLAEGDNFSNVGYVSNRVPFTATGTTPTTWDNGTVVIDYDTTGITVEVLNSDEPDFLGDIVWSRDSRPGMYIGTLEGRLPFNRCITYINSEYSPNVNGSGHRVIAAMKNVEDDDKMRLYTFLGDLTKDGILINADMEIKAKLL